MTPRELIDILSVAEKLKCVTRHCVTSSGRPESVAEHSWRIALMAMLISGEEEFRDADMNKVIRMCLIHDLGEAFTGDIPTFLKVEQDEVREQGLFAAWVAAFPPGQREEFTALVDEMNRMQTREARIYKALDKMEAVIQHNESPLDTWLPLEYDLQRSYGAKEVQFSPWMRALKAAVDDMTEAKIAGGK